MKMMDLDSYLNELERYPFPTVRYRSKVNIGYSVVNFFALAMGLFMMSAPMMGWIDYQSPSLGTAYMFAGFCQYLIGFYDWYAARTMLSFIDFVFGLLHFVFYYTADLGKYGIYIAPEHYTYMQGVFYCLLFATLLVVLFAFKNQGCMHKIYIFLLALACVFLIIWEFSKKTWPRKVAGYIIFVAAILIWYTGLARLIFNVYSTDCLPFVSNYWNIWSYNYENNMDAFNPIL